MVRQIVEKGLQETEALLDKVRQAGEMRKQIDGLPAGVVKDHMSNALAELERELAATVAGQEVKEKSKMKGEAGIADTSENSANTTAAEAGDKTYQMMVEQLVQTGNSVLVKGRKDALALAVHLVLLGRGFLCYAEEEEKGGPTGFAPPIRPIPPSRMVPSRWNDDPTNICLAYRHAGLGDREVQLKVLWMDEERVVVELKDCGSGGKIATMALHGPDFVKSEGVGSKDTDPGIKRTNPLAHFQRHMNPLAASLYAGIVNKLVPPPSEEYTPSGALPPSQSDVPRPGSRPPFQGERPFDIPVPNPLGPMAPPGYAGYGRRGGDLVPDFEGDLRPGGGWGGPGGGNLMGPDHPMFTGGRGGVGQGGGGGLGMPQPRFDPYGPVIPPNRGGPPARGPVDPNDPRGRGRAFRDPDPDHLPPPGPPGGNFYF